MEITMNELCKNKLVDLGEAIILLLNGKKLSSEQLKLIKDSTEKQKNLALMIRAATTLKGQEYENYCHNVRNLAKIKEKEK